MPECIICIENQNGRAYRHSEAPRGVDKKPKKK